MHLSPKVADGEFAHVFPDSVGWLSALAGKSGTKSVVAILKKIGYVRRGLPINLATMHLCFAGQLGHFTAEKISCIGQQQLQMVTRMHKNGDYFGHPAKVFATACCLDA